MIDVITTDEALELAENSSTRAMTLGLLARDADVYVRWAVARNSNASDALVALLATDGDERVREAAEQRIMEEQAWDEETAPDVLALLARNWNAWVRLGVAGNPNTPDEALEFILKSSASTAASRWIAAPRLLSDADRVTFDALKADGWKGSLHGLLDTVAALAV